MKLNKNNLITALIVGSTTVLGGIAIFTAIKLYGLRQSPGNPQSNPQAQLFPSATPSIDLACKPLSFSIIEADSPRTSTSSSPIAQASLTPSPIPTVTATPTASPTSKPTTTPTSTPTSSPTTKPTATPTASAIAQASPTTSPTPTSTLPEAGISFPTIIGLTAAAFLIIGSMLIAL